MILLVAFAFLAGLVTIFSPCILPILPIVLSSSVDTRSIDRSRPMGVIVGFVLSFTFFTLFLTSIVKLISISPDSLRLVSVIVIAGFGLSLLVQKFQLLMEKVFSRLSQVVPQRSVQGGFTGGVFIGLSLGLLWTPCVGPILASVISLAITGTVTFDAFLLTLAYSLGTAIPMFFIMIGGQRVLQKVPWLIANTARIQKIFGVVMILTALAILTNADRSFQTYILNKFPQYGVGLTKFEDIDIVKKQLEMLGGKKIDESTVGKPMFESAPKGAPAPEIIAGGVWFNASPLTIASLREKVVVIDFWTYTCINCQRTLPYLKKWWEKYKDKGLVIIGVHAPEFEFEKDENNVRKAIADFGLTYPIVQDNEFRTWRAYENHYWPAKYFIDKDGYIRYTHFGEGGYDESEKVIQDLLKETGMSDISRDIKNDPAVQNFARTPETYLGFARIDRFVSPENILENREFSYSSPAVLSANTFAYDGKWIAMSEYANPQKDARLLFHFDAKEVYLVMRSKKDSARIKVSVDGVSQYFGEDAIGGIVTVDSDRLYKLISLPTAGQHTMTLEFLDGNAELFAFTFG
ncbi:cytochrome c biogenesis protein DipZ [Candidatus Gottesmanbacteria bacterium]|nr:cytochrome c biogenesis protein DipZ [Candidatus Gottesmanbacteria bacterium]